MIDGRVEIMRLTGSSALNFLVWDRASQADYDVWEKLGNEGWNWDRVVKYIKKAETWTEPTADEEAALHATLTKFAVHDVHARFGELTDGWVVAGVSVSRCHGKPGR